MGWLFVFLVVILVGVPVFIWAYHRHLKSLTGPWIANEVSRND
jgi:hypothetical protein